MNSIPIHALVPVPVVSLFTSLLLLAGLLFPAYLMKKRFSGPGHDGRGVFGFTLILLGLINTVIYLTVHLQIANLYIFRIAGILVMLTGLIGILYYYRKIRLDPKPSRIWYKSLPLYSKLVTLLLAFLGFAYFLLSQSPLTDIDSLDYHMGFPVVNLFYGYDLPMQDWFHSRLFGIGESFNFLGLSNWTDHLSSTLQYFGLVFLVVMFFRHIQKLNTAPQVTLFPLIVFSGVPVLLHIVPSQKSELLGNLAVLYALSIIVLNDKTTKTTLFLAVGSLFFAMSIKYSFYVTALFPLLYVGWNARQNGLLKVYIGYLLMFYLLLIFPLHLLNIVYYGNPVSPLFSELFNENESRELSVFASYLKDFTYNGFRFPLSLLLPESPGSLSTILGLGLFTFLFLDYRKSKTVELVILAALMFMVTVFFVQRTSRFFLDAFFVILLAFIAHPLERKRFGIFHKLLALQTLLVAASAIFGVYTLFPGSLTKAWRERTLSATANNYQLLKYIDRVLPSNACIISDFRDNVYNPRNFIAVNYALMIKHYPEEFISRIKKHPGFECFYIAATPLDKSNILVDAVFSKEPYLSPEKFPLATRNPFNKIGEFYNVFIYKVNTGKLEAIAKSNISKR